MKRRKNFKRILVFFSVLLIIFSSSAIFCFADASEIVPFINIVENRPNATTQGEIYYTTSVSNETWSAQISQKGTGVIGVRVDYDDNRITQPFDIIRTQFDYTGWDNNARVNFSAGYGEFIKSDQSWTPVGYIGFTLKMNPWLVAGDGDPRGIILDCYRTYGYTLDYQSNERYYLSYDELVKVDYDGVNTAVRLNMYIDSNTSVGTTSLYLNTSNGTIKIDTINTYIIDPYIMQWGMFDPVSIDTDLEPFAIRNVQKYVVDNGYTEGFNDGYQEGVDDGEYIGFEEGKAEGKAEAYAEARDYWYNKGKADGLIEGASNEGLVIDVPRVIDSYFSGVRTLLDRAFDFEIFGINIAGLIIVLICLTVVGFIIKMVI